MAIIPSSLECSLLNKRKSRWEKVEELNRDHFTKQQKPSVSQLALATAHYLANSKYSLPITRWGKEDDKPYLPPPFVDLPPGLSPSEMDQFLREQRHDELSRKIAVGELEVGDPDIRPPSPPPAYDKMGNRVNTRDVRVRNAMKDEYFRIVENLSKVLVGFAPPADYKPVRKFRRIEIPLDKYPEYNFMGLIIGPRGCNHKRLETESGAQISIRGKGTQKEGKRSDHQTDEEAAMPMHVYVCAENEDAVDAVNLIEPLLDPFHPLHDEYKRRGLEQLALVNGVTMGTLDNAKCTLCGENGHMAYTCPDAGGLLNYARPQVKCEICGDMGHVTMDCKMAKPGDFKILNTLNGTRYPTSTFHSGGISFQPKQEEEPKEYVQPEAVSQGGYYVDPSSFNQSWNNMTPEAYQYYYQYYQQYYQQYMNDPKYQEYFKAMQQMGANTSTVPGTQEPQLNTSEAPLPPEDPPIPEPDEPLPPPPPDN